MNDPSGATQDPEGIAARSKAAHRQVVIVAGSLIASLFVYAAVVEFLNRGGTVSRGGSIPDVIRWALYAVAVSMVFMSHVVKGFMLRGFNPKDTDEALARLTTVNIVTFALSETPAVIGLVLFLVGSRFHSDFYVLSLISLYLMARHFPRYGQWEAVLRQCTPRT